MVALALIGTRTGTSRWHVERVAVAEVSTDLCRRAYALVQPRQCPSAKLFGPDRYIYIRDQPSS
jgi:hypothetical protein